MKLLIAVMVVVVVIAAGGAGFGVYWWMASRETSLNTKAKIDYSADFEFKDDVSTNTKVTVDQLGLEFLDRDGKSIQLSEFRGKKTVVLVFLRGLTRVPGGLCPACNAQTSRLTANQAEFAKRDAEVLIVFPGAKEHVAQFVRYHQEYTKAVPFSILLDENYQAVDRLKIRADEAKPSTFILDKEGQLRFAYVGATSTDRPSLAALYKQLDALGAAHNSP